MDAQRIEQLHALADGELTGAEAKALRDELHQDPALAAEYEAINNLRAAVKTYAPPIPNDELWVKCQGRLAELDRTKRVENFFGRYAWGVCGVLFFVIAVGGALQRGSSDTSVAQEEMARIMTTLGPQANQASGSPALQDHIERVFKIAGEATRPDRLDVIAVDEGMVDGRRVIRATLQDGTGPFTVMLLPGMSTLEDMTEYKPGSKLRHGQLGSAQCMAWCSGEGVVMLVANRTPEQLAAVAARLGAPQ